MKRLKKYAFLCLALGLFLTLTPTQSFASRYLTVGHRTDDPAVETTTLPDAASTQNVDTDSGQLGSGNIIEILIDAVTGVI